MEVRSYAANHRSCMYTHIECVCVLGIIFHDKFQVQAIDKIRQLVDASSFKHKSNRTKRTLGFKMMPKRNALPISH